MSAGDVPAGPAVCEALAWFEGSPNELWLMDAEYAQNEWGAMKHAATIVRAVLGTESWELLRQVDEIRLLRVESWEEDNRDHIAGQVERIALTAGARPAPIDERPSGARREEIARLLHDANTGRITPDADDSADYAAMAQAVLDWLAGARPAVPDTEAVREAEAWLRENLETLDWLAAAGLSGEYIATIVRATLARDAPAPAGRDLTADDVDAAVMSSTDPNGSALQAIADHLNRIARPGDAVDELVQSVHDASDEWRRGETGGVGQPDTAEPDGVEDGVMYWLCHREDLDVSMDNTSPRTRPPRITVGSIELDVRVATRLRDALTAALAAAGAERVEDR